MQSPGARTIYIIFVQARQHSERWENRCAACLSSGPDRVIHVEIYSPVGKALWSIDMRSQYVRTQTHASIGSYTAQVIEEEGGQSQMRQRIAYAFDIELGSLSKLSEFMRACAVRRMEYDRCMWSCMPLASMWACGGVFRCVPWLFSSSSRTTCSRLAYDALRTAGVLPGDRYRSSPTITAAELHDICIVEPTIFRPVDFNQLSAKVQSDASGATIVGT